MAVETKRSDSHGSLRNLQILVNHKADLLADRIGRAGYSGKIEWVSPLEKDGYAEYSDRDFLAHLGLERLADALGEFWPKGGPNWDGLGKGAGSEDVILVEAKANLGELLSSPSGARPESKGKIDRSVEQIVNDLGLKPYSAWTGLGYQYANRLAHLWFLRNQQKVPAYLLLVYFINDTTVEKGPRSQAEWEAAIYVLERFLGVSSHRLKKYVLEVFIDTQELQ